jgi:phage antirepressor YoqD-like protein
MRPKNTQKSIDHQKLAHEKTVENNQKSNIITLKAPKKMFTKSVVFRHPKISFNFWTRPIDACKNHLKTTKKMINIWNDRKNYYSNSSVFNTPK